MKYRVDAGQDLHRTGWMKDNRYTGQDECSIRVDALQDVHRT